MNTTFIYALTEPNDTSKIRYIGKSDNPDRRFIEHLKQSKDETTYKANWIKSLLKRKEVPEIIILDEVSIEEWEFWEVWYYNLYKSWGFNLTNTAVCGIGGRYKNCFSQEQIELLRKISKEKALKKWTQEMKDKAKQTRIRNKDKHKKGKDVKPRVKIEQYNYETKELIKTHNSIKECSVDTTIPIKKIQEVLQGYRAAGKGTRKNVYSYKGFTFKKKYANI